MTEQEFQNKLIEFRNKFLNDLKENIKCEFTAWDINNGFCFDFADEFCSLVPEAQYADITGPLGKTDDDEYNLGLFIDYPHGWIYWNGKHYDAECIEGVIDFIDLPFFKNVKEELKECKV